MRGKEMAVSINEKDYREHPTDQYTYVLKEDKLAEVGISPDLLDDRKWEKDRAQFLLYKSEEEVNSYIIYNQRPTMRIMIEARVPSSMQGDFGKTAAAKIFDLLMNISGKLPEGTGDRLCVYIDPHKTDLSRFRFRFIYKYDPPSNHGFGAIPFLVPVLAAIAGVLLATSLLVIAIRIKPEDISGGIGNIKGILKWGAIFLIIYFLLPIIQQIPKNKPAPPSEEAI